MMDRLREINWRFIGALAAVGGLLAGLVGFALFGWGALAAGLFSVGLILGVSTPPLAILLLRDGLPNILATGLAICAQVAFGTAALVRRDDGAHEWTVLRGDWAGAYAELADGRRVPVDVDAGDVFSFGFGRLAVTEQKTDRNMSQWTVVETPGNSEQAVEHRAGQPVKPPRRERSNSWLVSLTTIQRAIRGSASSKLVRRGRDKALDEEGGEQQLSQLWTMGFAAGLLIVGFVLGYGALML